ncbi:MAG: oligosaccharyl transferase, archaeosortase A system-associated [Chloroflexi bacterium]|nr:oligosaccharyl transferase, archaeosortase A system-associated [Chloroflexota bacterium]
MSSNQPKTSRANRGRPAVAVRASATAAKKASVSRPAGSKIKPGLITAAILTLFIAVALFLRAYLPYDKVFTPLGIKFTSNDSYFFLRLVDNLIHNFPQHTHIDPYLIYPGASGEIVINFFVWLISVPAWMANFVWPGQHTIDTVAAFMPAVLGALTVIPVYFIGKELFGRWAGVLSAGLIAILPGEFLGRSILGFTDNHVAETLLTTVSIMFLILAIKVASQRQLTLGHLKSRDWATIKKPLVYSLLAALFLGLYMAAWLGALLFVFITFVYFVVQFISDHLRRKSTDYLSFVGVIFFSVALLAALMISSSQLYLASLFIAVLAIVVLNVISRVMAGRSMKPIYYPVALLGMAAVGGGLVFLANRSIFNSMVGAFSIFKPVGAQLTTIEMQPLISRIYGNPLAIAWGNFNVSFFLSFISLAVLIYVLVRYGSAEKGLLVVWSLIILGATLGQRRFGYYLAVNVALLTGYLSWKALELAGFKELSAGIAGASGGVAGRRARRGTPAAANYFVMVIAVLIIFFGVFFWNIQPAVVVASATPYAPSDAWVSSLTWLKDNSPEPLGIADAYYQNYPSLAPGQSYYPFPESAYGVLAWWDYGYWITRIAHRIPNANPSQDPVSNKAVATFFTSQNETAAGEVRQTLGSAYIVIDHETTLSKFWAIVTWAGKNQTDFFDTFLVPQQNNTFRQAILYYPEYYRSMAVRLFNFDGKATAPDSPLVVTYTENKDEAGNPYKVITAAREFTTIEEAEAYLASLPAGNSRIVGSHPLKSPMPLEAIEHYKLVHNSEQTLTLQDGTNLPSIKIFQYEK